MQLFNEITACKAELKALQEKFAAVQTSMSQQAPTSVVSPLLYFTFSCVVVQAICIRGVTSTLAEACRKISRYIVGDGLCRHRNICGLQEPSSMQ